MHHRASRSAGGAEAIRAAQSCHLGAGGASTSRPLHGLSSGLCGQAGPPPRRTRRGIGGAAPRGGRRPRSAELAAATRQPGGALSGVQSELSDNPMYAEDEQEDPDEPRPCCSPSPYRCASDHLRAARAYGRAKRVRGCMAG